MSVISEPSVISIIRIRIQSCSIIPGACAAVQVHVLQYRYMCCSTGTCAAVQVHGRFGCGDILIWCVCTSMFELWTVTNNYLLIAPCISTGCTLSCSSACTCEETKHYHSYTCSCAMKAKRWEEAAAELAIDFPER